MTLRRSHRLIFLLAALALLSLASAHAQDVSLFGEQPNQELQGEGWPGFLDYIFLANFILSLLLATVLGALIAYHPKSHRRLDSIEDVEMPKIFIMYAVVGAVIGTMVLKYGLVVGLVVFGIGGLIRFRTSLGSATQTGRLIFVTLIGLCSGLDLPHVSVVATAFGFVMIYVLDSRATYRITIKGLSPGNLQEAASIYRSVLEQQGCRILGEKKDFNKAFIAFVFRTPSSVARDDLEHLLEIDVPDDVKGSIDWESA
jgi:MFS family permease